MPAHPRIPTGRTVTWQRPPGRYPWPTEGVGLVRHDHGRTVTLADGTLLLRREATLLHRWALDTRNERRPA